MKIENDTKIKDYSIIDADADCDGEVRCSVKLTLEDGGEMNGFVYVDLNGVPDWTSFEKSN
jgi:hypothetical protein